MFGMGGFWDFDIWGCLKCNVEVVDVDIGFVVWVYCDMMVILVVDVVLVYVDVRLF